MVEIAVLVGPEGVRKTQIYCDPDRHAEGFSLYEKILPTIREINMALRSQQTRAGEKGLFCEGEDEGHR